MGIAEELVKDRKIFHFQFYDDFGYDLSRVNSKEIRETGIRHTASYVIHENSLIVSLHFVKSEEPFEEVNGILVTKSRMLKYFHTGYWKKERPVRVNPDEICRELYHLFDTKAKDYKVLTGNYGVIKIPYDFFLEILQKIPNRIKGIKRDRLKELNYSFFDETEIKNVLSCFTESTYSFLIQHS